jgi:hypothetical protein
MFDREYSNKQRTRNKKIVYVVAEGSKREPQYFEKVAKINSRVKIIPINHDAYQNNSPRGLLRLGENFKKALSRNPNYVPRDIDEFWFVLDVDDWPNLRSFIQKASAKNWKTAISNPCFEVWLYFHFYPDPPEDYQNLTSTQWKNYLNCNVVGGFNSSKHCSYFAFARGNAENHFRESHGLPDSGATNVFKLFEGF